MFQNAYRIASFFTGPVITSMRFHDSSVATSVAAYVVLNKDGWIVTAAHVLASFQKFQNDKAPVAEYRQRVSEIQSNPALQGKARQKHLGKLSQDPKWIINHSYWWGQDRAEIVDVTALPIADLAVGRLNDFDTSAIPAFPELASPAAIQPGSSVCRLGFPFHEIRSSFDEQANVFRLEQGALPVPRFPLEGMVTREVQLVDQATKEQPAKFIETSTPGLRGQSGGPLLDVQGRVWGIQSRTMHLPLGFSPKLRRQDGREVEEHQFINVGMATHVETLRKLLDDLGIPYSSSTT